MHLRALAALLAGAVLLTSGVSCGGGGDDSAYEIAVVGQNILHGMLDEDPDAQPFDRVDERIVLLADGLAGAHPDLILLQEVNVTAAEDYPDIRGILTNALGPDYTSYFGDITGAPIDEGALGQLTFTSLPVLSSENRHIGGVRAVHRVTVETPEGVIDIYNAHLDGTDDDDPQLALDEIAKVMTFIEETRTPGAALILAGDFNARPDEPAIRTLRDENDFADVIERLGDPTCEQAGDPGCTNSTKPLGDNPEHLSDQRIDYIFVRSGEDVELKIVEAGLFMGDPVDIGGGQLLWVSDHIGVQTVLEVRGSD